MCLIAIAAKLRADEVRKKYHYGIDCKNCKEYIEIINEIFTGECVDTTGIDNTDLLLDEYNNVLTEIEDTVGSTTCENGTISVGDSIVCTGVGGSIDFLDESNITIVTPGIDPVVSEDVITVVVSGSGSTTLPVNSLLQVVVLTTTSTSNAFIGTTPGGSDVISTNITAGTPSVWTLNYYYESGVILYFTGNFTAKLYIA